MTTPRVSVLMPVYNPGRYLGPAVESILNQTYRDFELIALDDGSTDGSGEVLDSYARRDARVRVIHQSNQGVVATLNYGLELAHGEYIARMDADDLCAPTRFEKQVAYLDAHREIGVLGTQMYTIDSDETPLGSSRSPFSPTIVRWTMLLHNAIAHPTVMARRDLILKYGGYEAAYVHAEDFALWTRMAVHENLANLPDILFTYRWSDANVSNMHRNIQLENSAQIVQRYTRLLLGREVTLEQAHLVSAPVVVGTSGLGTEELQDIVKLVLSLYQAFNERFVPIGDEALLLRRAVGDYLYPVVAALAPRNPLAGLKLGLSVLRISRNPQELALRSALKLRRRLNQ